MRGKICGKDLSTTPQKPSKFSNIAENLRTYMYVCIMPKWVT